ncbi:MAG TPA: LysR family transcriptional regulator [Planctomycetota bacterium]|nr:LysR family transcriptional regulator [Planctomycetota bacterium]
MLNLEHARTFLAIIDAGGFHSAGTRLDLSQPTVSQQLRKLEAYLGAPLLIRRRGRMTLTRHGELFLPAARGLLRAAERAETSVTAGPPAVGASSNVGVYLLQRHLRRFRDSRDPPRDVSLRIGANPEVHEWLRNGAVDLAVVEWWPRASRFEALAWRRERLVAILPPGHRWAGFAALPAGALLEEPILGGEPGTGTGTLLREVLGPAAGRVRTAENLGSTEAVKQAVKAGLGISVVIESAVEEEQRTKTLVVLPIAGAALAKEIQVVLPRETPDRSPARDLVRVLMSES